MVADIGEAPSGADWQINSAWEISPDQILNLRDLTLYLTKAEGGYSPQKIHNALLSFARDGYVPSHDMISRFINSTTAYKAKRRDSYILLVYFLGLLRKEKKNLFSALPNEDLEKFADYCEQYFEDRSIDRKFRDRYVLQHPQNRAARSSGAALELLAIINSLALPEQAIFGTDRLVFAPNTRSSSEEMTQRYLTYRYGVEPHFIFKSFMTLSKKRAANSPVVFKNTSKDRLGQLRSTSGFGLNLGTKLYLIGNLDRGSALEIVAFSNFSPNKMLLFGLAMSVSAAGQLLVARIVLKKVADSPSESELGRKSYEELKDEIHDFAAMIANRVDFDLTRPVMHDGSRITQNAMVEAVSELLRNQDGKPRFTYEGGAEFNPASSSQYTFNAALTEFR